MSHSFLQTKQLPDWSAMLPSKIEADINHALTLAQGGIDDISTLLELEAGTTIAHPAKAHRRNISRFQRRRSGFARCQKGSS